LEAGFQLLHWGKNDKAVFFFTFVCTVELECIDIYIAFIQVKKTNAQNISTQEKKSRQKYNLYNIN
jgi:hypothetical protein